jgi:ribosomal protein S18 acetylase RimI-like enzyme
MACDLSRLVTGFPPPTGVKVGPVEDYDVFVEHPHPILKRITTPRKRHIFGAFQRLSEEGHRRHWMFAAQREGRPLGTAILFFHQENAGIYDVEVLEPYRKRGIGTMLLETVCTFAAEQKVRLAVLAASEQGPRFYTRFGFEQTGRYPTYYYSIKKQQEDAARARGETW